MKPGAPWSIKGVEPDARDAAKAKAQAAGMTLGQWLNQVIQEADKPRPAPQPQPGSALDTARIMRAVAEVARRVDLLREGEAGSGELGGIEARLDDLARRLDEMDAQRPAAVDLTSIETRLAALDGHLEHLAMHPAGHEGPSELGEALAAQSADLKRVMNGLLNLARKIDMVESGLTEKVSGLKGEVAALQAEIQAGSATVDEALAPLRAELAIGPLEPFGLEATDEEEDVPPAAAADETAEDWTTPEERLAPSPEMAAALHDLTSGRDVRTGPPLGEGNRIFRDLPPFEPAAPAEEPPAGTEAQTTEAGAADEPPVIDLAGLATLPDDEAATEDEVAAAYERDEDPAEPPHRVVAVEALLTADADTQEKETPAAQPRAEEEDDDEFGWQPVGGEAPRRLDRLDAPITDRPYVGGEVEAAEAERRRPPVGYALAAFFFLVLLVGGYVLIGSERFDAITGEARRLWAEVSGLTAADPPAPVAPVEEPAGAAAPTTEEATTETADEAPAPGTGTGTDGEIEIAPAPDEAEPPAANPPEATELPAAPPAAPADETRPDGDEVAASPPRESTEALPAPTEPEPATPPGPFEQLLAEAEGGDAEAQYRVGLGYRDGDGVKASYDEAATWFDRAAHQGHVEAQLNLGAMYRQGVGVPKDVSLAKVWLHNAARAGHPEAQKYLGEIHAADDQGRPDFFQAARWFREAAEQGLVDAQYNMGVLYEDGLGVPRDNAQAYYWFGLAAAQGDASAAESQARVAEGITAAERTEQDGRIAAFQPERQWPDEGTSAATATPSPAPATTAAAGGEVELTRRDLIGELQQLLIERGYDPGVPDGLPGERTREAIRQFQRERNLPEIGRITEEALGQLRSDR